MEDIQTKGTTRQSNRMTLSHSKTFV